MIQDKLKNNTRPFRIHPELIEVIQLNSHLSRMKIQDYTQKLAQELKSNAQQPDEKKSKSSFNLFFK